MIRSVRQVLAAGPLLAILYVFVYHGRTVANMLLGASIALWIIGIDDRTCILLAGLAVGVSGFNIGLALGRADVPPR